MKLFPLIKEEKIIVTTTTLHNSIQNCGKDEELNRYYCNHNYIPQNQEEKSMDEEMDSSNYRRVLDDGLIR